MKRKTQVETILNHLKVHGTITSMEAFSKYGITRISEYIRQLREKGYDIETVYKETETSYGKRRYGVYTLHENV